MSPPVQSAIASDLPPDAGRRKKKKRDAGNDDADAAPPSSKCGCEVVGAPTNGPETVLVLAALIALFAYTVRRLSSVN